MKHFKFWVFLFALFIPVIVSAQKAGYDPYQVVASVNNGVRNPSSAVYYLKFDGNMVYVDYGIGQDSRWKYSDTQNGNSIYYREVYNHGTIYQGSGYIEDRNQRMIVSPNRENINIVMYNSTLILKKQSSSSAGEMIY